MQGEVVLLDSSLYCFVNYRLLIVVASIQMNVRASTRRIYSILRILHIIREVRRPTQAEVSQLAKIRRPLEREVLTKLL